MKKITTNDEIHIIKDESPYVLDRAIRGDIDIPALTRKNADFIEAILRLDSNYKKDVDVDSTPGDKFNPFGYKENNKTKSKSEYCGSTAYWFNKMNNGGDFKECLLGAIISIDRVNSTHLESTKDGRNKIKEIIIDKCHSVKGLKKELNKDFRIDFEHHLIGLMSVELAAAGKETLRSNLSFASKFCAYASLYLGTKIEYSKYDNVVATHLKNYIKVYLNDKSIRVHQYKYDSYRKKNSEDGLEYTSNIYCKYYKIIGDIIDLLKSKGVLMDRNEFDSIVWYCNK